MQGLSEAFTAFGIEVAEERELAGIGCAVIDTTCGWVRAVWRAARAFIADLRRDGLIELVRSDFARADLRKLKAIVKDATD